MKSIKRKFKKSEVACGTGTTALILARVRGERARQRELLAARKIDFDCAEPKVWNSYKLAVLCEEVGEVSKEVQEWVNPKNPAADKCRARMQTELIQVAAVAVAWAESLES